MDYTTSTPGYSPLSTFATVRSPLPYDCFGLLGPSKLPAHTRPRLQSIIQSSTSTQLNNPNPPPHMTTPSSSLDSSCVRVPPSPAGRDRRRSFLDGSPTLSRWIYNSTTAWNSSVGKRWKTVLGHTLGRGSEYPMRTMFELISGLRILVPLTPSTHHRGHPRRHGRGWP